MGAVCRILSAVTLVVHLLVGCCAHHAHACDATGLSALEGHTRGDCGETADHSHHGPDDCQGVKCSFVSSSRPASDSAVFCISAFFTALPDRELSQVGSVHGQFPVASGRLALAVRLHLANQVLLL